MPYGDLLNENKIEGHAFSPQDLEHYLAIADTKLADAGLPGISADGKYEFAYAAVRSAAQAVMAAEGYRTTTMSGHHKTVFDFLREVESGRWATEATQFDDARKKRNVSEYERRGLITDTEARELFAAAGRFVAEVREWLGKRGLLPPS